MSRDAGRGGGRFSRQPFPASAERPARLIQDQDFAMFGGFAKAIFGSSNDRYVRSLRKIVDKINAFEPTISAMTDDELQGPDRDLQRPARRGRDARRPPARGLRHGPRGGEAHARPAPLRRPADRRHRPPPRRDRRDAHRRGQDPGRDARRLSQRARRARASTSSPSTTISPAATPTGWARSTASSA